MVVKGKVAGVILAAGVWERESDEKSPAAATQRPLSPPARLWGRVA